MTTKVNFLASLPDSLKVATSFVGILTVGIAIGVFFMGFTNLPERVVAVEAEIVLIEGRQVTLSSDIHAVDLRLTRLVCIIEGEREGESTLHCNNIR